MATACTKDETTVNAQVIPMFSMPGCSRPAPTTCHHMGKNVLGLYQSEPLTMLTITHATTANQFTEAKSIRASIDKLD
jgi:hypothetical protein